jgi:hypothetical protein
MSCLNMLLAIYPIEFSVEFMCIRVCVYRRQHVELMCIRVCVYRRHYVELMCIRVCVYRRHHVEYPRIPYLVLSHFLMHAGINCRIFKIKNSLLINKHLPVSEPTNCGPYGVLSSVSVAVY